MRRTRWTVTMADGERKVILDYSGDSALLYYRVKGFDPVKVVKGDYRHAEAMGDGTGWTLNRANYRAALDFFGIRLPVTIKQTSHKGGRYGAHQLRPSGGLHHHITVKSWLSPEQAGQTLWHELTHAMQAERCAADNPGRELVAWRQTPERRGAYARRPIEVEARSYESFNVELPLANRK